MPRWPRPPNLLRLLVGQHIINGLSVGVGVVAVALVASAIFGFAAGQPATLGAISASISDLPAPWREKAKTLGFGFALALISTVAIQLALPWPVAALVMIGVISFVGGLVTGLGRWAVAVGMQAVIPMVFILGFPRETFPAAVRIELLLAAGGFAYIAFALLATVFTDASARRMVASESIREFSIYMRAVAGIFDPDQDLTAAYGATIRQQSALSEQLQSARALLLERPGKTGERMRLAASIGILLDALDALVAAQCDVELIRQTPAAATVLAKIVDALRVGSLDLEHLSLELLTTGHPILPPDHQLAIGALKREAARVEGEEAMEGKSRAALDAATWRLVLSLSHVRRLERALSDDETAQAAIGDVDLAAFIPKRRYGPRALAPHVSLNSPVLRIRCAPGARDDGRRSGRAIAWRRPARQLGPADHRGRDAGGLRADPPAARRPCYRHAGRLRCRGGVGGLSTGRRAGRGPGARRRRDPQFCPAQLPFGLVRRLGDRAGVAAPGPAVGFRADPRAPRGYADWRSDRPSLQLLLAALGIFGGAAAGQPAPGPARRLRQGRAHDRRQPS